MKKYLYVFFAFLACLFVSQNVHASSPSYDVLYYGGTCHKGLQLRYRQRLRWKVVIFKENPRLRI